MPTHIRGSSTGSSTRASKRRSFVLHLVLAMVTFLGLVSKSAVLSMNPGTTIRGVMAMPIMRPTFIGMAHALQTNSMRIKSFHFRRAAFRRATLHGSWKLHVQQHARRSRSSRSEDANSDAVSECEVSNEQGNNHADAWKDLDFSSDCEDQIATPASVDIVNVRGRDVHVQRDDLLQLVRSRISGNKARKMISLNAIGVLPSCLVSYGGPQSNSMLALAAIVASRRDASRFVYYAKALPKFLKQKPNGNLEKALELGMELVELSPTEYKELFGGEWGGSETPPPSLQPPVHGDSLWVPQGGAFQPAKVGAKMLANEIYEYWSRVGNGRPLAVCIPGGTCTTAALVHAEMRSLTRQDDSSPTIRVVAVPCVGDRDYAERQMMSILQCRGTAKTDGCSIPHVMDYAPNSDRNLITDSASAAKSHDGYFPFAQPHAEVYATFEELRTHCGLTVDLIYGAPAWSIMLRHWGSSSDNTLFDLPSTDSGDGYEIMYVHSGGLEGIESQLQRYRYKGLIPR